MLVCGYCLHVDIPQWKGKKMNETEKTMLDLYEDTVVFANLMEDSQLSGYALGQVKGVERLAEALGYILYKQRKHGLCGNRYAAISIAKVGGPVLEQRNMRDI